MNNTWFSNMINAIKAAFVSRRVVRSWLAKYDMVIYGLSVSVFKRLALKHEWFGYALELHIKDWNREHPISDQLKVAIKKVHKQIMSKPI